MLLPGYLDATTLGDLLGSLFRAGVSGALEVIEKRGGVTQVHLRAGRVVAVLRNGEGATHPVDRRELVERLRRLEQLTHAQIRFRVALRPPSSSALETPLHPDEFLRGRLRRRDRRRGHADGPTAAIPLVGGPAHEVRRAYELLGVAFGSSQDVIKRAYRAMVRCTHPDLQPGAGDEERRLLGRRFAELTQAYQLLRP